MDMDGMYVLTAVLVVVCARNWWLYHQNLNLCNTMQELDAENEEMHSHLHSLYMKTQRWKNTDQWVQKTQSNKKKKKKKQKAAEHSAAH